MPDDDPREASADVSGRTCGTKEKEGVSQVSGDGGWMGRGKLHYAVQT